MMNLAEMLAVADQAAQGVELNDNKDFAPVDPGTYSVAVTNAEGPCESKKTNPNNPSEHGQYLKIECTITGPKFVGRKLWMNNNIICFPKDFTADSMKKCQTAIAMGARERKVMLDSIGKTGIQAASELVGATFLAVVATEKGTNGYKDKSVIKSVKSASGGDVAPSVQSAPSFHQEAAPAPAPSAAPRAKMPWEK